jgi:dipeptidyl-peptidase-4
LKSFFIDFNKIIIFEIHLKLEMKKLLLTLTVAVAFHNVSAQEITLDKIYSGYYRGKGIAGITSMKNGENYLVIEPTELQNILIKLLKRRKSC